MRGAYLLVLLVALAGVGAVDARWRLVLAADRRSGLLAVGAGVVLFLAWDAVALAHEFYSRGRGSALLGIDVLPRLPVEEVVFVTFLAYLAAVVHAVVERVAGRADGDAP